MVHSISHFQTFFPSFMPASAAHQFLSALQRLLVMLSCLFAKNREDVKENRQLLGLWNPLLEMEG